MNVFVLMPFATEFDDVFSLIIRTPLEAAGFTVGRADESRGSRNIMHDVIQGISSAELVIADLTGANPNVYYELGIAHALGRPTLLLSQDLEDIPFDLRAYRVVTYSTHFARVSEAIQAITAAARGVKDGTSRFGSPVSDFVSAHHGASTTSTPSALPAATSTDTDEQDHSEESGIIDHTLQINEGMNGINAIATQMGQRFEALNPHIVTARVTLESAAKHDPLQARSAVQALASAMNDYTRWLKPANSEYRQALSTLAAGLDGLFAIDLTEFHDSNSDIAKLQEVLDKVAEAVRGAVSMSDGLIEVVGNIPRLEKEFNRARRFFLEESKITRESLNQTAAVLERARDAAHRLLSSR